MALSVIITITIIITLCDAVLDPRQTILSGPGLKNDFSLPVQYFYIQPVDDDGRK